MTAMQSRRIRGPITVLEISGFGYERRWSVRTRYASIDEFARSTGYHREIVVSPQGRLVPSHGGWPMKDMWCSGLYVSYEVYDSDDVLLPSHVVLDDIAAFRRNRSRQHQIHCWKMRGWPCAPENYFRNGPLPGSGRRLRRPKDYKRIGTSAEVRKRVGFEADLRDEPLPVRLRGKRSRSMIGDNDWEGVWSMRSRDRSWKRHRDKQWRA